MERFIQCKCARTKDNKLIPVWELEAELDEENDGVMSSISNNLYNDVTLRTKNYREKFIDSDIVDAYYDLLEKKVVIGRLVEISDSKDIQFNIGDEILVESSYNEMSLKVIESVELNKNKYSSYFVKSTGEKDWTKGKNILNTVSINDNLDLTEIRYYDQYIYKFTDGTTEIYKYKFKN